MEIKWGLNYHVLYDTIPFVGGRTCFFIVYEQERRRRTLKVIDFHSHILPGIDDGSRDVGTSLAMLSEAKKQGVDVMIATPHFYAWEERMDDFLAKREAACEALFLQKPADAPEILVGAEVAFFKGIGRAEQTDELTVEGTEVILLEMPFRAWQSAEVDEVLYLAKHRGKTVVLAHLERYLGFSENKKLIKMMLDMPFLVQINAEALLDRHLRGKAIKLFKKGQAHLLGSDCHGMHRRPPNLSAGREVIEKRLGAECLARIDRTGTELIKGDKHA